MITLGSPGTLRDPAQSRAGAAFRRQEHRHVAGRGPSIDTARPIPVPSTAIYSKRDGIVHWRSCIEPQTELHQNVQVRCSHLGFGADPETLWVIADRLAQRDPAAQPFRPPVRLRRLFPASE